MKRSKFILTFYIGMIALSVATLSMSIAWYASADIVRIEGIDITIDADRAIQISTSRDGEYKDSLDKDDLQDVGDFIPLTGAHSALWMESKQDSPIFYDEANHSNYEFAQVSVPATQGFLSQKLYLKTDDDLYITIDADKTMLKANKEYNRTYAKTLYGQYQEGTDESLKQLTVEEIEERLNKLVNAMRYSILVTDKTDYQYVIIDPNKEGTTLYGGLLDNDIDRYYDYFIRESDGLSYERLYGEYKGEYENIVYDEPLQEDTTYESENEEPSAFNARHKKGVRTVNLAKSLENGIEIVEEKSYTLSELSGNDNPFIIPVYRDTPKEIVLSIYIEGWDLDSVNYTMGATFVSSLTFKIEREM